MNIYKTAVKNPITSILVFVAVAIFGIFSFVKLPIDLLPHIDTTNIMVITAYPGASALDIEENITKPLENSLNAVDNLKHITSKSRENISVVTCQFEYGTNVEVATANIRDKLDVAINNLPDEVNKPIIFKFGTDDIPIMLLAIKASESWSGLYKIIDDRVSTPLARVNGVGTVSVQGIPERQIQIYCDPYKLEAYGLTIEGIAQTIAMENRQIPAGTFDIGNNTYSLRVDQEFESHYEMFDIVVGQSNGSNIYLRDVASIEDTQEERTQEIYSNSSRTGLMIIQKQTGANSVEISKKVAAELEKIRPTLPADVTIEPFIDTSEHILDTADSLINTILTTFIVVMFVVMIMLGRWRATIIIVLTIPISMLSSLIYLLVAHDSLNIITMSAISISIGMVVDNAIVVLENITSHVDRGVRLKQAAVFATKEVGLSIIASTLTTLAVFFPLTFITGMAGVLFRPMGWMVSVTLTVSMCAALTLTPVLATLLMKQNPKRSPLQKYVDASMEWLGNIYGRALDKCIHYRKTFVLCAVLLFVLVVGGLGRNVKTEFFPTQDNARIAIKVKLPVGTRQEITRDVALRIVDQFMKEFPEIKTINVSEGVADSDNSFAAIQDNGSYLMSFNISLTKKTERERGMIEIAELMRKLLKDYTQIRTFEVNESGQKGGAGGASAVDLEIYGYDLATLDNIAAEVKNRMLESPKCSQVTLSRDEYTPEYQVVFDREKLAKNGLNIATAASFLRSRINGSTASYFREDGEEYDIIVRYQKKFRESVEDIENITLYSNQGKAIKVRDVGHIIETQTPPTIERKDRSRYITVSASVAKGYALSEMIDETVAIMKDTTLPAGITWGFGGTYEDQKDVFADLTMLLVLMIILVYVIMASQFESLAYPMVIMFSLPFALVGVMIGMFLTGTALSVMAMLGILMLVGIVVNNGIVLVDYTRLCIGRGMPVYEAVVSAGRSRLRPILMTTLTTVIGMIPMAIGTGVGAEMWNSLGMSVAWGLSFSTLVTLFLIPVLFTSLAFHTEHRAQRKKENNI